MKELREITNIDELVLSLNDSAAILGLAVLYLKNQPNGLTQEDYDKIKPAYRDIAILSDILSSVVMLNLLRQSPDDTNGDTQ